MTRLRGRAARGQRVHAVSPHGHWHTTTMIAGMRVDGTTACLAIEGATDAEVFRTFIAEVLLPTLRPGDIVVMDNLAAHKPAETVQLITGAGATALFLPAYSPDLNPIEKMWSKVKNTLRAKAARTLVELQAAIGQALAEVTGKDAANWFGSCGYSFC